MKWSNVWLIFQREVRDQLRDRRTLFMIGVLPLVLYPLLGMTMLEVSQLSREYPVKVALLGSEHLPKTPPLVDASPAEAADAETPTTPGFAADLLEKADVEPDLIELQLVKAGANPAEKARGLIHAEDVDAVLYLPADLDARVQRAIQGGRGDAPTDDINPYVYFSAARERSKIARSRVNRILSVWRDEVIRASLAARKVPAAATQPFVVQDDDLAEPQRRDAAMWSKILPFVVLIWSLTGAFYPAIDLCAGEKERGTLETLLASPADRGEIVWGKLLTVMLFSVATSLVNVVALTATGGFMVSQLAKASGGELPFGAPPLLALLWLLPAIVPMAATFSALSLAVAAMARSTREGQYYLMPLLLISLPLLVIPMLPAVELDLGTSLIPLSGVMLLLRALIEGDYLAAALHVVPVAAVTYFCVWLSIRWAIDQFNNEDVLFPASEQFDLGAWLSSLVQRRGDTPTVAESVFCGLLILIGRFFATLVMPAATDWTQFATTTLVVLIGLVAAPPLIMAVLLTRNPRQTLLLRWPSLSTLTAAAALAVAFHPIALWLGYLIQQLYPLHPDTAAKLESLESILTAAPNAWALLGVLALAPAVCEELAFRGFILSGLRRLGHKWGAILISAALFGVAHGLLQQSISAAILGTILGYVAIKSGSLLPGVIFHLIHNGVLVLRPPVTAEAIARQPWMDWVYVEVDESYLYRWPVVVAAILCVAGLLWYLKSLPYDASPEEELQDALDHQLDVAKSG